METKVGIGVAIIRKVNGMEQVLLGKRKGSHGAYQWGFPGGHLEYMESFNECALREIAEEVGPDFVVEDLDVCAVTNLVEYAPKHYVDIGMVATYVSGDPQIMEPDKVSEWRWFEVTDAMRWSDEFFATVEPTLVGAFSEGYENYGGAMINDKEQF
jgi:8-oxo-dGTP diphosphatase